MKHALFLFSTLSLALWGQATKPLTILHTNDIHARLLPNDKQLGGFAYVATVLRHEREGCTHCMTLNAGDVVQGTPVSTMFRGLPIYEVVNAFGYDASTLGNHEFDYGWKRIKDFEKIAKFPILNEYTFAVADFTASTEGAPGRPDSWNLEFSTDGPEARDLLIDWIKKKKIIE